jgi:hypothetical protein
MSAEVVEGFIENKKSRKNTKKFERKASLPREEAVPSALLHDELRGSGLDIERIVLNHTLVVPDHSQLQRRLIESWLLSERHEVLHCLQ